MPNYLHRTTKAYLTSTSPADLTEPEANYIQDPDLSAVEGFPSIYWTITGDVVTLQSQAERDATDAAILAQQITEAQAESHAPIANGPDEIGMRIRALIELFNKRDNYLVNRIAELQQAMDAMKATTGNNPQSIRNAIPASWLATNTRPRPDAITDFRGIINGGEVDGGE